MTGDGDHLSRSGTVPDKRQLRRTLLDRRRALAADELDDAGRALAAAVVPLAGAGPVAAYASVGAEPPTGPLLEALSGVRVLLPVLREDGDLDWAEHDGRLVDGPRGTRSPAGPRLGVQAVAACPLVVVPALAVDRRGVRLGRGGGSYDRALPRARGRVLALVHDGELLDALPEDPHDVRVDGVVTPSRGLVDLPATLEP